MEGGFFKLGETQRLSFDTGKGTDLRNLWVGFVTFVFFMFKSYGLGTLGIFESLYSSM